MDYILTFGSAHRALKAEKVLKAARVGFRLITAPKELAKYCDLVISIDRDTVEAARRALDEGGVAVKAVYRKENEGYVEV